MTRVYRSKSRAFPRHMKTTLAVGDVGPDISAPTNAEYAWMLPWVMRWSTSRLDSLVQFVACGARGISPTLKSRRRRTKSLLTPSIFNVFEVVEGLVNHR